MRTRTLLLLAIGCGLVILLAGGIQLLRLGGQPQCTTLKVDQPGTAGDVTVELVSTSVGPAELVAVARVKGADDPNGLDGFSLVGPGKVVPVASSDCNGITVGEAQCALTFSTTGMQGTSRDLIFRRADQQLRWVLAAGQ
jgi:hypothetical protein